MQRLLALLVVGEHLADLERLVGDLGGDGLDLCEDLLQHVLLEQRLAELGVRAGDVDRLQEELLRVRVRVLELLLDDVAQDL